MSSVITIGLPLLVGFGFLYWSSLLDEDEEILKLLFRLLFIPFVILSVHAASIYARIDYASDPELVELLADISFYSSIILYLLGAFYLCLIIYRIYQMIFNKKQEHKEEMYD